MKQATLLNKTTTSRLWKGLAALAAGIALAAGSAANPSDEATSNADANQLLVMVNDVQGYANIEAENAREDILQAAFQEIALRNKWIGDYRFEYNYTVGADQRDYLKFNVVRWERTRTGMIECSLAATYIDPDGAEIQLGNSYGMRSGIAVTSAFAVSESFQEAAEDAMQEAIDTLKEKLGDS